MGACPRSDRRGNFGLHDEGLYSVRPRRKVRNLPTRWLGGTPNPEFGQIFEIATKRCTPYAQEVISEICRIMVGGGRTRTAGIRRWGIYSPLQLPLCDTPKDGKVIHSNKISLLHSSTFVSAPITPIQKTSQAQTPLKQSTYYSNYFSIFIVKISV